MEFYVMTAGEMVPAVYGEEKQPEEQPKSAAVQK